MKECRLCNETKELNEFAKQPRNSDNRDSRCKDCVSTLSRQIRKLRKKHGPPPMCCDCCGKEVTNRKTMHLDHDHKTGDFRGWLCNTCNTGIGSLGDSVEGLENAIRYLNEKASIGHRDEHPTQYDLVLCDSGC